MKKEHLEVMLESIDSKFNLVRDELKEDIYFCTMFSSMP